MPKSDNGFGLRRPLCGVCTRPSEWTPCPRCELVIRQIVAGDFVGKARIPIRQGPLCRCGRVVNAIGRRRKTCIKCYKANLKYEASRNRRRKRAAKA